MANLFQKFCAKVFFAFTPAELVEQRIASDRIKRNSGSATFEEGAELLSEATIDNFSEDQSKIRVAAGTRIRGQLLLFAFGGEISIGKNCYVGENSKIWSAEKISIGNDVLISHNVNIIDTDSHELNHQKRAASYKSLIANGHAKSKGEVKTAPIEIEDNAWISYNVSILKGVKIGKGTIIAAGSVLTTDADPFSIYAGNPAIKIKTLDAS